MSELTWTEIAVQLSGEVPVSCKMAKDGGLVVRLASGKVKKYSEQEVERAIDDLEIIADSSPEGKGHLPEKGSQAASVADPSPASKAASSSKAKSTKSSSSGKSRTKTTSSKAKK